MSPTDESKDLSRRKIPVGISSCLLGERVRYDGGHKAHSYITGTLGEFFEFHPFCPEMSVGLGVPRTPIRLVRQDGVGIRCVSVEDESKDFSDSLASCADQQLGWQQQLCGYILKKDSPSCGMERVKVWGNGMPIRDGVGIFAGRLQKNLPYLPMEEEGRLGDAVLRENFIQRVFAMWRWHEMSANGITIAAFIDFHARHKLIIMSHCQTSYRELGKLVAETNRDTLQENAVLYLNQFMDALKKRASRGNHVNVLQHIQGYLKTNLVSEDKQELVQTIEKYRLGQLPLIVPITLLNHFFRKYPDDYIARSWYMSPYPEEMSLQNEI